MDLKNECFYSFVSKYVKIKVKTKSLLYTDFDKSHRQFSKYQLKRLPVKQIPIILGPSFAKKRNIEEYEIYCKMMLILFKPWTDLFNLKINNTTWIASYEMYLFELNNQDNHILQYIQNIGLLCKSKEDAEEEKRTKTSKKNKENINFIEMTEDDDENLDYGTLELINIIGSTLKKNQQEKKIDDWIEDTEQKLDLIYPPVNDKNNINLYDLSKVIIIKSTSEQNDLLSTWDQDYITMITTLNNPTSYCVPFNSNNKLNVLVKNPIDYELNESQQIAFDLFTRITEDIDQPQKIIYLTGEGGTGKTAVISKIKEFFRKKNMLDKICFSASTAKAANLLGIGGNIK